MLHRRRQRELREDWRTAWLACQILASWTSSEHRYQLRPERLMPHLEDLE